MESNLQSLDELGPEHSQKIRAELTREIALVEGSTRVGWLPLEHDIALTELVARVSGDQALWDWSLGSMLKTVDAPLLRPAVDSAVRLFGLSPDKIVRLAPRVWQVIYRNAGDLEVRREGPSAVSLLWRNVPGIAMRSHAYRIGIAASLASLFEICRVRGTVSVDPDLAAPMSLVFRLAWR